MIRCGGQNGDRKSHHCILVEEYNVDSAPVAPSTPSPLSIADAATTAPTQLLLVAAPTSTPTIGQATSAPSSSGSSESSSSFFFTPTPTPAPTETPTAYSSFTASPTFEPSKRPVQSSPSDGSYTFDTFETSTVIPTLKPSQEDETSFPTSPPTWPRPLNAATSPPTLKPSPNTMSGSSSPPSSQENNPKPSDTTTTMDSSDCKSDESGDFGFTNGAQSTKKLVQYQYQVETRPKYQMTALDMTGDNGVLSSVEKAISDLIVATLFSPGDGYVCVNTTRQLVEANPRRGSMSLRRQQRILQSNWTNDASTSVVGLSAKPTDRILDDDYGVTCPFPTDSGEAASCFVVQGGFSVFGGNQESGDLSWVEPVVLAELEGAMGAGALDKVDPAISSIRFIPPNTLLNNTGDNPNPLGSGSGAGDANPRVVTAAPTWSWIVAGVAFIGVAAALVTMVVYRRRRQLNQDDTHDFDSAAPRKARGAFPSPAVEILDENSECDHSEVYRDDDEDDEEESSFMRPAAATSWKQVLGPHEETKEDYSHLDINSTDPNKPVVQPILDEESEIMDIYI